MFKQWLNLITLAMLDSIEIRNFKAIGKEGLKLEKLAQVNYLVGPNGSGKSSVFDILQCFAFDNFYKTKVEQVDKFILKRRIPKDLILTNDYKIYSSFKNSRESELIIDNSSHSLKFEAESYYQNNTIRKKIVKIFCDIGDESLPRNYFSRQHTMGYKIMARMEGFRVHGTSENLKKENSIVEIDLEAESIFDTFLLSDVENNKLNMFLDQPGREFYKKISEHFTKNRYLSDEFKYETIGINHYIYHPTGEGEYNFRALKKLLLSSFIKDRIVLIEEIENGLESRLLKEIVSFIGFLTTYDDPDLDYIKNTQFFITTHSPFIINAALQLEKKVYQIENGQCKKPEGISKIDVKEMYNIFDALGAKPSDLLFANGLIWVEGPSDIIYIQKWLEIYADETGQPKFTKGSDYEFEMFGGVLLKHYLDTQTSELEKQKSLIDLFKINPRNFIVFDFDDCKSKFENAKQIVLDEFEIKNYWYDTTINTIEFYIPKSSP